MFDRFIRLARAKKALGERRYEDALRLSLDPGIASERRAEEIREASRQALLERGRRRLDEGDLAAAEAVLARLTGLGTLPAQEELVAAVAAAKARAVVAADAGAAAEAEVRGMLQRGTPAAAERRLAELGAQVVPARAQALAREVAERAAAARQAAGEAEARFAHDDFAAAGACLRKAIALGADVAEVLAATKRLRPELLRRAVAATEATLAADGLEAALDGWRALLDADERAAAAGPLVEPLVAALRVADLAAARRLAAAAAGLPLEGAAADLVAALGSLEDGRDGGIWAGLARIATAAGAHALAGEVGALAAAGAGAAAVLAAAQRAVAAGDLEGAAGQLREYLLSHPLDEGVRRELAMVEEGLAAVQERLQAARAAAREGRLAAAATAAAALAGPTTTGVAAAQLLAEVKARMAVVDRGIDEVRVALHGKAANGSEGVRHCARRLQALAQVHADHAELPRLITAVTAEADAIDRLHAAREAAVAGDTATAWAALVELAPRRSEWLAPDRLDARLTELAERVCAAAEAGLARGEPGFANLVGAPLSAMAWSDPALQRRAARLQSAAGAARAQAEQHVAAARSRLLDRDLAEAERLAGLAAGCDAELPALRELRTELRRLQVHAEALDRAQRLADERDFVGAEQKLAGLPPTPAFLRTRIYDMKQNLAKAQGLEGTFLLRVDEGGECLVVRGESITIGNVRQANVDLPLLANIAGRHASVRRSMSFHGGMQDTIVAEEGTVAVGGAAVQQRALAAGDVVRLGQTLALRYEMPSARSLTARLVLQGGFQVAGTDRVLLMKDRGKDGRILLGPGRDAHVRVARADREVELYAAPNGQIRVACSDGGRIDGVPFRGEHPVDAGQVVEAGGVSFVLLPWRPGA